MRRGTWVRRLPGVRNCQENGGEVTRLPLESVLQVAEVSLLPAGRKDGAARSVHGCTGDSSSPL